MWDPRRSTPAREFSTKYLANVVAEDFAGIVDIVVVVLVLVLVLLLVESTK